MHGCISLHYAGLLSGFIKVRAVVSAAILEYSKMFKLPSCLCVFFFFFNDTATTEIYTLSLHDALPILRNRRQLNSLQNTWPYGYSMPIAVRYTQDAFSRSGWLWPVDAKGEPLKATRT